MKIKLYALGKTSYDYIDEGVKIYQKRIPRYLPFEFIEIPLPSKFKKLPEYALKEQEGKLLLKQLGPDDKLFLLDEKGKSFTSLAFSVFIQSKMNQGLRNLCFVIGGAHGFSDEVYQKAEGKISLSDMTFSHQMIRLFAVEQIYRALSILKGDPYHNP